MAKTAVGSSWPGKCQNGLESQWLIIISYFKPIMVYFGV